MFDAARQELRRSEASGDRVTLSPTAAERLNDAGIGLSNELDALASQISAYADVPPDLVSIGTRAAAFGGTTSIVDFATR